VAEGTLERVAEIVGHVEHSFQAAREVYTRTHFVKPLRSVEKVRASNVTE
jgi:hypothetical protein